jgi:hypothetical protein
LEGFMSTLYARGRRSFTTVKGKVKGHPNPIAQRLRNAERMPVGDPHEIVTDFAQLDNGVRVETVEDPTDHTKTLLAIYENGSVRLDGQYKSGGRLLAPVPRDSGIFNRVRLPRGAAPYKSIRSLLIDTRGLLCACLDIDPALAYLVSLFILSSWFAEKLPVAPYVALVGMPRSGKTTLLRLLQLLCRRSILVADISSAAFYQVYEQTTPTLLIDETRTAADQKKLFHLLRSGSTPGFVALRKDSSSNCYGPKVFAWTELPDDRALNTRCIVIPMYETDRTDLKRPTDPRILLAAEVLQKQFLQLRLENFNLAPPPNVTNVKGVDPLHSRNRDLYEALAYPIAYDKKLCQVLALLIGKQDQFTREPLSARQGAVLGALVTAVHSPGGSAALVADMTRSANRVLADQGEKLVLTPHAVGDLLTSFGIHDRKRTNKGWLLQFDQELRRKIHLLIKRYGADCNIASRLFEVSPNCFLCKELQVQEVGGKLVDYAPSKKSNRL